MTSRQPSSPPAGKKRRLSKEPASEPEPSRTGITWCGGDELHRNPSRFHPERPERVVEIIKHLRETKLLDRCEVVKFPGFCECETASSTSLLVPPPSSRSTSTSARSSPDSESDVLLTSRLAAVHNPNYLARFDSSRMSRLSACPSSLLDESSAYDSVYLSPGSALAARLAAAASLSLSDALSSGLITNGLAVVRPPGHHAEACCAKGFCLYNNVAAVARALVSERSERVLIVDWDVHFGNGTAGIFREDENPCYFSIHRHDKGAFFPPSSSQNTFPSSKPVSGSPTYVGLGAGLGRTVNVGWSGPGPGSLEYLAAFSALLPSIASDFAPTVVLVSAGFDAARGDTLGGCDLTPSAYGELTRRLLQLPSAKGRVLLFLEGGYNLAVLPPCVAACVEALLDDSKAGTTTQAKPPPPKKGDKTGRRHWSEGILPSAADDIRKTVEAQKPYWKALREEEESE